MGEFKHGYARRGEPRSPTYKAWRQMRRRCNDPRATSYRHYGARGIGVCSRWDSFEAFLADMGERPIGGELDRIDSSASYCPENCRWASRKQQNSNRRTCVYLDCDGERVTLREYCDRKGLSYRRVVGRRHLGWNLDRALSEPPRANKQTENA